MRLLDLFCGQGGASVGYHRAGFEVVGVDRVPQHNYPFAFHQREAMYYLYVHGQEFDAIHASPPCQAFTAYRRRGDGVGENYRDRIAGVRNALREIGKPYVIENVEGAPLENAVRLCGSSFGLDVRRHRYFESNVAIPPKPCDHSWQTPRFPGATNRAPSSRRTVEVGVGRIPLDVQQRAMGIDWMNLRGLSQAIPPAYTEYIGAALMEALCVG